MVKQLISQISDHTHPVHHAESTVHVAQQNLKRKASGGNRIVDLFLGGLLRTLIIWSAPNHNPSSWTISSPFMFPIGNVSYWNQITISDRCRFFGNMSRTDVAVGQMSCYRLLLTYLGWNTHHLSPHLPLALDLESTWCWPDSIEVPTLLRVGTTVSEAWWAAPTLLSGDLSTSWYEEGAGSDQVEQQTEDAKTTTSSPSEEVGW